MSYNIHGSAYRPDIDGLRAVAVVAVVAFHTSARLLPGGFIGVDIFFVISGYLISRIIISELNDGCFSFLGFYGRRVRRIFPALVTVLLATWAIGFFSLSPADFKSLGKHIAAGSGFLANIALWYESGYFDTASELKPLLHLWSLGVEEQFYIVWPIILGIIWKFKSHPFRWILLFLAGSFGANLFLVANSSPGAFFLPHSRFWELLVGGAVAWLETSSRTTTLMQGVRANAPNLLANCGAGMIVAALVFIDKDSPFPGWPVLLPVFGAVALISSGRKAYVNKYLLGHPVVVSIGLISYPLYLWHWPLLAFTRIDGFDYKFRAVAVVVAFVLSYLTYRFIERPVRTGAFRDSRKVLIALAMSLSIVGVGGGVTYAMNGYEKRFPEYMNRVLSYEADFDLKSWKWGDCFMLNDADYVRGFSGNCLAGIERGQTDSLLIWGDSIAASIYPGVMKVSAEKRIRVAQYTTSNCPPFLDFDEPNNRKCRGINDSLKERILAVKPYTVVLSAYWLKYAKYHDISKSISQTVAFLREAGVRRVILVGPLPKWSPSLPRVLFSEWRKTRVLPVPNFLSVGLDKTTGALEVQLSALASKLEVSYASPFGVLCRSDECMTRVGLSWEEITSIDSMHFTVPGAIYVSERVFPALLN